MVVRLKDSDHDENEDKVGELLKPGRLSILNRAGSMKRLESFKQEELVENANKDKRVSDSLDPFNLLDKP